MLLQLACGGLSTQAMPGIGAQPGDYRFGIHTMPGWRSGPFS